MLFKRERLTESSLPVFGSSLAVLGFVCSFVFIGSQPQTPPLQANLDESRMQSNTVGLFSHFFNNHFVRQAFHTLVNLRTTLKFVGVLQVLRVTSATFAPLESYSNKRKLGEWPIATDTEMEAHDKHSPRIHNLYSFITVLKLPFKVSLGFLLFLILRNPLFTRHGFVLVWFKRVWV